MGSPQVPRPDQRVITTAATAAGSRSGSGELAGALGFPGVPAAVPNCQGAALFQQGTGQIPHLLKLTAPGRIWMVTLSYVITSNASFSQATARTATAVQTILSGLTLATIELGVANNQQHDSATVAINYPGLPVQAGETLILNINGGGVIPNLDQQASVSVLYSTP